MGPRVLWIAVVAIAFLYLIFRPHFGTVYYLNAAHARMAPGGKASLANSTALGHSLFMPAAPVSVTSTFTTEHDCQMAADAYNTANHAFGAACAPRSALLWGW